MLSTYVLSYSFTHVYVCYNDPPIRRGPDSLPPSLVPFNFCSRHIGTPRNRGCFLIGSVQSPLATPLTSYVIPCKNCKYFALKHPNQRQTLGILNGIMLYGLGLYSQITLYLFRNLKQNHRLLQKLHFKVTNRVQCINTVRRKNK